MYVRSGLNSQYFHVIGDGPIKGGMTIHNIGSVDPSTYMHRLSNKKVGGIGM